MQQHVKKVWVEFPKGQELPPERLVITFPSSRRKRRRPDGLFATLKDRLPLSFKRGEVKAARKAGGGPNDHPDVGVNKKPALVQTTSARTSDQQRSERPEGAMSAEPGPVESMAETGKLPVAPASAVNARLVLEDPQDEKDSLPLDKLLERQLLRAADDDAFDQAVLPMLSSPLFKVKGLSDQKDALVLQCLAQAVTAVREPEEVTGRSGSVEVARGKRSAPGATAKPVDGEVFTGEIELWEYWLETEIFERVDNAWFRKTRRSVVSELETANENASQVMVVDAPSIGWWDMLPAATLEIPGRRNVNVSAAGGIAPDLADGDYYDQYKDLEAPEYSDADSVDYGGSDSDREAFHAWYEDSDDEEAGQGDSLNDDYSSEGDEAFKEYL